MGNENGLTHSPTLRRSSARRSLGESLQSYRCLALYIRVQIGGNGRRLCQRATNTTQTVQKLLHQSSRRYYSIDCYRLTVQDAGKAPRAHLHCGVGLAGGDGNSRTCMRDCTCTLRWLCARLHGQKRVKLSELRMRAFDEVTRH
ncbi:hypothetical protein BAUCODRAFT_545363 [Baudoinia panamericana UAMH 10762]|uniref:Uncharacterized protein n=1 Tax=Baudoinia panamericana (strain UAMH 10762) TaxID=717646 RepID=M2N6E5_BAUPA|nr:uncharacterized protein BAUCODRAFT_545363 [Baudoinia panamericana UAMH 10762]EMC94350.1 hypothetical protein BAUCODRAFT_545363 [Baudoinia panamericana UAMH 10762]